MTQSTNQIRQSESGFTLVELAIVMIIIGLLIGGILKGQELITNARVSSTVAQVKAIESGIGGFRDKYSGIPGDIVNPVARLPNCAGGGLCAGAAAPGVGNGDGNAQTGTANDPNGATAFGSEAGASMAQLGASGFLGGMTLAGATLGNGVSHPNTPLGGVWNFGYSNGIVAPTVGVGGAGSNTAGHYITAANLAGAVAAAGTLPFEASHAFTIDSKLDDGIGNTGTVQATGGAPGATTCVLNGTFAYNTGLAGNLCGLFIKVQ